VDWKLGFGWTLAGFEWEGGDEGKYCSNCFWFWMVSTDCIRALRTALNWLADLRSFSNATILAFAKFLSVLR